MGIERGYRLNESQRLELLLLRGYCPLPRLYDFKNSLDERSSHPSMSLTEENVTTGTVTKMLCENNCLSFKEIEAASQAGWRTLSKILHKYLCMKKVSVTV